MPAPGERLRVGRGDDGPSQFNVSRLVKPCCTLDQPGLGGGFDRRCRRHHGASSLRPFRNLHEICPQGELRTLHDVTTGYSWVMNMHSLLEQGCAGAVDLGLDIVPDEASIDLAAALIAEAGRANQHCLVNQPRSSLRQAVRQPDSRSMISPNTARRSCALPDAKCAMRR